MTIEEVKKLARRSAYLTFGIAALNMFVLWPLFGAMYDSLIFEVTQGQRTVLFYTKLSLMGLSLVIQIFYTYKYLKYERRLQKKLNKNLRTMRIKDYF